MKSGRTSTRPGANGVVELSPREFLDRLADLVPKRLRGMLADRPARDRHPQPLSTACREASTQATRRPASETLRAES
jgi:hypothetical protein